MALDPNDRMATVRAFTPGRCYPDLLS